MDGWPPVNCRRFDGESEAEFRRRSSRIVEIVKGFRFGRHDKEEADGLERELLALQNPAPNARREMAYH